MNILLVNLSSSGVLDLHNVLGDQMKRHGRQFFSLRVFYMFYL